MSGLRVGNAPVSWGVYEAGAENPPYEGILDAIRAAGYAGTELGPSGYLPTSPEMLRRAREVRGLELGSSFVPLSLEDTGARKASVERALEVARLLATQSVRELIVADDEDPRRAEIAGRVPDDGSEGFSDDAWREAAATLEAVARALKSELDMRVVVHHLAGTFIETPAEIERLLEETDPELVGLLLDTGHLVYGGGDPLDLLARHGERVWYVHLKDARADELERVRTSEVSMHEAWRHDVFCPLGQGIMPFFRLVERLQEIGYRGWLIVEQDVVPGPDGRLDPDPFECAKKSRAYLRDVVSV